MIFETFCAFIVGPLNLDSPISAEVSFSQFSVLFLQDITFTTAEMKSPFHLGQVENADFSDIADIMDFFLQLL